MFIRMLEQLLAKDDNSGNRLYLRVFMDDETKEKVSANIHLKLKGEDRFRAIGNYYFHEKTLYLKRKSEKHYHRVTKSYGFNYNIITDPYLDVKYICADIDDVKYRFPKSAIDDFGTYLHFKQEGFELQRFLKFALIKNYKE
jgi:hypothetical protein